MHLIRYLVLIDTGLTLLLKSTRPVRNADSTYSFPLDLNFFMHF